MELLQETETSAGAVFLAFDFFFNNLDYNLSKGKGFSLFNADEAAVKRFTDQCKQYSYSPQTIRLSSLADTLPEFPEPQDFVIIIQDLPFNEFLNRSAFIADRIIFPLWFRQVSMCFFSISSHSVYNDLHLGGNELHSNYQLVINSLLCEQIFTLLERVNYQFSSPYLPNLSDHKAISTPTEGNLRLGHKSTTVYPLADDLDPSQLAAVNSITGPIRVLAPAGSGKTKTLVNRILNLLNKDVSGEKILALAFNKKARDEMQERLERKGIRDIEVRTFHSLGYEIVRESMGWTFSGSAHKNISRDLMLTAIRQHTELPALRNKDPLDIFLGGLRRAKMDLSPLPTMTVEYGERVYPFEPIFYSYLQAQLDRNYLDFDDMIYLALRALLENSSLRHAYQTRFEFVLVDEFQDLNQAQLLLLQVLSLPENNVFVVGDDDQMIYGFRGAEVKHIIEFSKRFPVSASHVLSTNYRSSRMIVRHTGWLIDHNKDRVEKTIQPRKDAQEGSFEISGHQSIFEQAEFAAQWLVEHKKKNNLKWSDYAVLYRYNAYQFPVAVVLDAMNVPHTTLSGQHLFQTQVGKDIYQYLQVILSPLEATSKDFERILKRPNKYFTNQMIARARDWNSFLGLPQAPNLRGWESQKLADFIGRIQSLSKMACGPELSPIEFMQVLNMEFGLSDFYQEQSQMSADLDQANDEDILDVILALSENFKTVADYYHFVCKSMDDDESDSHSGPNVDKNGKDEVYLGTIHRAKGKEFQNVVYFNLSKTDSRSGKIGEEEERRVAYVGATRPKDSLLITFSSEKPSKFLSEICLNPKFNDYTNEYLERRSISTEMRLKKESAKLEQMKLYRDNLHAQFDHLAQSRPSQKSTLWLQLTWSITNWHMNKIQEKIESLDQRIKKQGETIIPPLLGELKDLEEELTLRSSLSPTH